MEFLKIAKPLFNYANPEEVEIATRGLAPLRSKDYNCLAISCYWHYFDEDGDGVPDVSMEPLRAFLVEAREQGFHIALGVEVYAVGGGQLPEGIWEKYPELAAVNSKGEVFTDDEYGFGTQVPSLFHPGYREASERFTRNIAAAIDSDWILYYETTVEPQYMPNRWVDFSPAARKAYGAWLVEKELDGPAIPEAYPIPESFLRDPTWNRFRAEYLADWVNGACSAFREGAGNPSALCAVDYLETGTSEMIARNGDSLHFLRSLEAVDIIQVNWHWNLVTRQPNEIAYQNLEEVMRETGRDWAITEHMTLNGSDYQPEEVEPMLENTLRRGTAFGWEFVNAVARTEDPFALYNDDWSPKPLIAEVDGRWQHWLKRIEEVRDEKSESRVKKASQP